MQTDSPASFTDARLAALARAGSSACFEELVRRFQVPLLRYVQRTLDHADAEDVVQDVFVQAYLHLPKYDARWAFKTWLFVIAQRLTIDRLRRGRLRRARSLGDYDVASSVDASARAEAEDTTSRLWAIARQQLNEEACRTLWLHYVDDFSAAEIAKVLGRSWVWVKTTLHRSRKKLRPYLNDVATVSPAHGSLFNNDVARKASHHPA